MAEAIVNPLVETKLQAPTKIQVYDVSSDVMNSVADKYGLQTAQSIPELLQGADLVVCAVKPQNLHDGLFAEMRKSEIRPDATLLSIVAGKPISSFSPGGFEKIARSMPNTPATIGEGITVWSCTDSLTAGDRAKVKDVLCCMGKTVFVDDESFVDMSTSISGSGPAYIFMLMEA